MRSSKLSISFYIIISILLSPLYAKDREKSENFMWKVEKDSAVVYLLGSIHAADETIYPLSDVINKAFTESDMLAVEVDIMAALNEKLIDKTLEKGIYLDNKTLEDELDPKLYKRLLDEVSKFGLTIDHINYMKPWLAGAMILQLKLMTIGYNPLLGIDLHFLERAKRSGKEIVEIESADSQIELLGTLPKKLQILFIVQVLQDRSLIKEELDKLLDLWKKGDAVNAEKLILESYREYEEYEPLYDALIVKRNKKMTEFVIKLLEESNNCFVVVGAGHLVGDTGIVTLLEEKGYKLEKK